MERCILHPDIGIIFCGSRGKFLTTKTFHLGINKADIQHVICNTKQCSRENVSWAQELELVG